MLVHISRFNMHHEGLAEFGPEPAHVPFGTEHKHISLYTSLI